MSALGKNEGKLVIKGKKNFYDVPAKWQADAREYIESEGYVINPDGTVSKRGENVEPIEVVEE